MRNRLANQANRERIAIYLPSLRGGGAERMMVNVANEFAQRGLSVDLVLCKAVGPYLSKVSHEVRIIDLNKPRVLTSLPALTSYLSRERPVSLLSTLDHANIVALWARGLARIRTRKLSTSSTRVFVREANNLSESSKNASHIRGRSGPLLARLFYPWADGIIAISKGVADDLASKAAIPRKSINVIYNPVVTQSLIDEHIDRSSSRIDHEWFSPGQPPVILSVGRLNKQKDFPTLIEAFELVRCRRNARLMILGEGSERVYLERLIREQGLQDIALPGFVDNPQGYMERAAVFALSSAWEGFGNVIVEAMLEGTTVVSTDCRSGPAEILDGGRYGELVPVGDPEALAMAIVRALDTPTPKDILQKRAIDFSIERIADMYLDLLAPADNTESAEGRAVNAVSGEELKKAVI